MTLGPRIKICCISSVAEARHAIRCGADALGLVSNMPSGPGVISEAVIAEIALMVPPHIATFLLTSLQKADSIAQQHSLCRTSTIQLVDRVELTEISRLRRYLPGVKLVQVIHVLGTQSLQEAMELAPFVDALLLDSGNPALATKELGGTGRVHDWQVSRQIRDKVPVPVFLAGGLNSTNVAEAIRLVQPFGLDLCSSVREDGNLSLRKLDEFMHAAQSTA